LRERRRPQHDDAGRIVRKPRALEVEGFSLSIY
jgi:hypothetical protein